MLQIIFKRDGHGLQEAFEKEALGLKTGRHETDAPGEITCKRGEGAVRVDGASDTPIVSAVSTLVLAETDALRDEGVLLREGGEGDVTTGGGGVALDVEGVGQVLIVGEGAGRGVALAKGVGGVVEVV